MNRRGREEEEEEGEEQRYGSLVFCMETMILVWILVWKHGSMGFYGLAWILVWKYEF